jgi:hypothetical protein
MKIALLNGFSGGNRKSGWPDSTARPSQIKGDCGFGGNPPAAGSGAFRKPAWLIHTIFTLYFQQLRHTRGV